MKPLITIIILIYILYEILDVKKKIIKLTQENAILLELLKEKNNK